MSAAQPIIVVSPYTRANLGKLITARGEGTPNHGSVQEAGNEASTQLSSDQLSAMFMRSSYE